jgi:hypothetical protein
MDKLEVVSAVVVTVAMVAYFIMFARVLWA